MEIELSLFLNRQHFMFVVRGQFSLLRSPFEPVVLAPRLGLSSFLGRSRQFPRWAGNYCLCRHAAVSLFFWSCCTWTVIPCLLALSMHQYCAVRSSGDSTEHLASRGGSCCLCRHAAAPWGCCTWAATPGLFLGRHHFPLDNRQFRAF